LEQSLEREAIGGHVRQLALRELSDKDLEVLCAFLERGGVSARSVEEKVALEAYRFAEQTAKRRLVERNRTKV
jgi:hypothetical protein